MFETLLAAPTIGAPWSRAVLAALVFHVTLIAAVVSRTASPPTGARPVVRDTIRLEITDLRKPSPPKSAQSPGARPEAVIPEPPRVPDIPLNAPELQPPRLGLSPVGSPESNRISLQRDAGESRGSPDSLRSVFSTAEVDELPELVEDIHLLYPSQLERAGVDGLVQLQYVVGRDGRVDERTIRVLASSHPAFLLAASQALRDSRFRPGRRGGRPTAVLVQQTFRFRHR